MKIKQNYIISFSLLLPYLAYVAAPLLYGESPIEGRYQVIFLPILFTLPVIVAGVIVKSFTDLLVRKSMIKHSTADYIYEYFFIITAIIITAWILVLSFKEFV